MERESLERWKLFFQSCAYFWKVNWKIDQFAEILRPKSNFYLQIVIFWRKKKQEH